PLVQFSQPAAPRRRAARRGGRGRAERLTRGPYTSSRAPFGGEAEDDDRRGKRGRVGRVREVEPTLQEPGFPTLRVLMPPTSIGPGGHQGDDQTPPLGLLPRLPHPDPYHLPVWRVHVDPAEPGLGQTVILLRVVGLAQGALRRAARVQVEAAE